MGLKLLKIAVVYLVIGATLGLAMGIMQKVLLNAKAPALPA